VLRWHSLGEDAVPESDDWLSDVERTYVDRMHFTKRRSEWRMARWTAKQALARALGTATDPPTLRRIEVRPSLEPATRGAPYVLVDGEPAAVGVSLTDRAGWAVCAVGPAGPLGCDLELDEPRSALFVQDYLTPAEQAAVAAPPFGLSPDATANLVWSAKESALKVLRTGLRRATLSVEVTFLAGDEHDGWRSLVVRDRERGADLPGWWCRSGAFVLTVAAPDGHPPPTPFDDPPALATAEPTHSWMAVPRSRPRGPVSE
jgi:4'-phosphopantetheinyl transferase